MNILYIDHYAGSLSLGMEFRPYYFAREWEKKGHNVRIIGADFSHLRKVNPIVCADFELQVIDGVQFQWIKTCKYKGNSIKRAQSLFQFCIKLIKHTRTIIKEFDPDVVISSSTYPFDTYPAQRIKKLSKKCTLIHEVHDIWPLTLIELGGMSKYNPFIILLSIAERSAYKNSNKIVSVLPNSVEHMLKKGLQNKRKFSYIPNGIVPEDWNNPDKLDKKYEEVFQNLKQQSKKIIMYLGGHALSNALDTFIDAADFVNDSVVFILIGNGVEKERLVKKAGKRVIFLPPVKKTQVPALLSYADGLYIGAEPCALYRYGVSMNKLYDYMMAGKPIIYGVEAWNNEVKAADCGLIVKPNDKDSIVQAVEKLSAMNKRELEQLGKNGKRYVLDNHTYSQLAQQFLDLMMEI